MLAGPITVKNLPTFGNCCKLAPAVLPAPVAVSSGTQYRIVADTLTGTGSDFDGVWDFVPPAKAFLSSKYDSGGWFFFNASIQEPVGAVYGTIP